MPTITRFVLDGNHIGVDHFKLYNMLDISSNINILSPFDIKGKGRTKILSPLEMHYVVYALPEHMQSLRRYFSKE